MTLEVQFLSMLASVGAGIWLGASFDTYKRLAGKKIFFRWTLIVNDLLFWILQAIIFFYILLTVNEGEVRFYLFIALLLGYSIYRAMLENIYRNMLEWMISFTIGVFRFTTRLVKVLIINPIKWLLNVVLTLGILLLSTFWRIVHFLLKVVLFPFRWVINLYIKKYGIPFHSFFVRVKSKSLQLFDWVSKWIKKRE
ncbi:spore cortex biosynthesis protein YabQ [Bacillus shivajii]|uniref:spore cortex biosynthesis protein YabQ n=1 Tax=Bacillus shivajii TaxID=1983719 RepID=UPI001CFAC61C|nr:spore cortex biosynthesis protein YabQ [Bacillus shivajii]UCZ53318.1 spore cortex biosynthesis protein YabQ [Bacillus shivajii]